MAVKIKELEIFQDNPFLDGVGYNQRKRTEVLYDGKQAVIHSESGEVLQDHLSVARVKMVDADQFVKVYLSHLHVFFDLGKPAQRVCEFVLHQVGYRSMGRGEVLLNYSEYEKFCAGRTGGNRQSFMRGVQELAGKNLIAKSPTNNIWWLNPAVAFNGDRARFITEIRKVKMNSSQKKAQLEEAGQQRLSFHQEEKND